MLYWVYVGTLGACRLELFPVPEFYKLSIIYLGVVGVVITSNLMKMTENDIFESTIKTPEFLS